MPDTIILRFRDIQGVNTIAEHRQLISQFGSVWWGWWRKIDEPDRLNELGKLKVLAKNSTIKIGLFDSEKKRFFSSDLIDCNYDSRGSTYSPDPHATPEYYRHKQIAAWFKLTNIVVQIN